LICKQFAQSVNTNPNVISLNRPSRFPFFLPIHQSQTGSPRFSLHRFITRIAEACLSLSDERNLVTRIEPDMPIFSSFSSPRFANIFRIARRAAFFRRSSSASSRARARGDEVTFCVRLHCLEVSLLAAKFCWCNDVEARTRYSVAKD